MAGNGLPELSDFTFAFNCLGEDVPLAERFAAAKAAVTTAQINLGYTTVTAPISGITSQEARSEGSLVTANNDLLTTLTQVNPIWVRFSLTEADFARAESLWKAAK